MARAAGRSPGLLAVHAGPQMEPVEFRLGPGHTIRGTVVDAAGKPLPGAWVVAMSWRGYAPKLYRSPTDAQGRFEWDAAPADPVRFQVWHPNGSQTEATMQAREEPYTVTLAGAPQAQAQNGYEVRLYAVRDLVTQAPDGPPAIRTDDLLNLIRQSCGEGTWLAQGSGLDESADGGSLEVMDAKAGVIAVRQTPPVHQCIDSLLAGLRESRGSTGTPKAGAAAGVKEGTSAGPRIKIDLKLTQVTAAGEKTLAAPSTTVPDRQTCHFFVPTPDAIGQGADGAHAGLAIELTPRVEQSPSAHIVLVIAIKQGEVSARVAGAAPQVLPGVGFPMTQVTIFLHSPTQDTLEITTTEPNGPHYRLEVNATAVPMASASAGPAQGTVIALRIYPIRDLITDVPGGPPAIRIGDLVDLIRQSCGDGPWPAGSLGVLPTDGGSIVVRQTRQVHECIEKLLKDLRASRSIRVRLEVGAYLLLRQSEGPGYEVPDGLSTVNLKAQPSGKPSPTMSDLAGAARWHVEAAPVEVGNGQPAKPAALEGLTVRPVVSADRRHVLLEVDPGVPSAGRTVSSDDGATDIVYFEGDAAQQLARRWMKPDELAGLDLDGAYVALTVRPRIEILQEIERPATASASGKLQGSVWVLDHEAALEQYMPELEAAGSKEAFDRIFEQMRSAPTQGPPGQSGAGATLTLRGGRVPQTTVADADGSFQFSVLHAGVYELTGRKPTSPSRTGASRVAEGMTRIEVAPGANSVDLELRTDLVSVRGRVTDTDGHPVAGATVTTVYDDPVDGAGQPIDAAEVLRRHAQWAFAATRTARTDADGVYELRCLEPMDFYATGRYLFTDSTRAPEYVNLRVEAEGFQQPGGKLTRVLLVTQDGLYWGERFMEAAARAYDQLLKKKQDAPLPAVHGNTITGVDIVLERTGPAAKAAAAATSSRTATEQERQRLMGLVEDFFKHNFRDITARDTIEWGDAQVLPNGNRSIRYKYRATIWGKDQLVYNFTFTFDANGEFVSIKDVPTAAGLAAVASIRTYDVDKAVSDFPEGEDLSTPEAAYATLNRLAATGDQGFWRRLSDKDLRDMMPASPPARRSRRTGRRPSSAPASSSCRSAARTTPP